MFVAPGSCQGPVVVLGGADADRVRERGLRPGDALVVLDNSGWAWSTVLEHVEDGVCRARVTERWLAPERRTQVSVYQGLLHPSDFRRLLSAATGLGVVAFVPVIADGSIIPAAGGVGDDDAAAWERMARDAAEAAGRGRAPSVSGPMFLDHALDQAARNSTVLFVDGAGSPIATVLADRPFSVDVFLPPPSGFSADERARAVARGVHVVAAPRAGPDPVARAAAVLQTVYDGLEAPAADAP
ncbi:hypothetical protein DCC79_00980 [bacterium]|nr:RsmE family RNA methyltransferase [Chloroflexi bacterium CFX6]RIL12571.1 MAG: hypothetical protein DCC79_00980 [bacterium]